MLDATQNCCRSRLALDHKLLTNSATVAKKFHKIFPKASFGNIFKGVFYPTLSSYTLDHWPCQPWSATESCDVVDLISKRNKLWKRLRDSLKIRNISNLYLHCTEYPPQYWRYPPLYWCYPPACTDVIPPMYWISSTELKLSPTVLLLSPHCTAFIPPLYCFYPPTVLNNLHSTEGIPHSTEGIPHMYWSYPPTCTEAMPPTCTAVIPPTVLKVSLHSTEYPPQYWCYLPTVLMLSTHCTE